MPPYITEDMMSALQGVVPSAIASSSADGIPNVTFISQVFYVDREHVALSRQFFNKTVQNITQNPVACVVVTCPVQPAVYKIKMRFVESQTTGEVYENMRLQLEVIAGMQGMSHVFNLVAADLYKIISIERVYIVDK